VTTNTTRIACTVSEDITKNDELVGKN